jgi:hypothetical protein
MGFRTGKGFAKIRAYSFPDVLGFTYIDQFILNIKIFINSRVGW